MLALAAVGVVGEVSPQAPFPDLAQGDSQRGLDANGA